MKRKQFLAPILIIVSMIIYYGNIHKSDVEKLRDQHQYSLDNSPFKKSKSLSKKERIRLGLPPNAYNEQMWELTMDPATGRPMPERVEKLQQELRKNRSENRGGGGDDFSEWTERGPNNIGGRTRGVMFDPNDADHNRVFAGGVSGGLWVNEDITDADSQWTLVPGIGANISVTVIISDPIDSNIFYIGSGESYTNGQAIGRGIWKSTDGGVSWENIFGGFDSSDGGQFVNGIFYINDLVARINNGSTELYASIAGAFLTYSAGGDLNQFLGLNEQGLYKSTDGGDNWTKFSIEESNGSSSNPNDIEIDLDNNIWFTTTRSNFGFNGGKIFRSTDGITFDLVTTIPNAHRTELEPSSTDVSKFWVAIRNSETREADLFSTDDAFETINSMNEPNDADNGIPSTDYTRGQSYYDLPIEADANDILYVGGIDLFRSTNGGDNWTQISKWSNNNALAGLNIPLVHADHHAIVFRPGTGNENQAVLANDGGVYYTPDITEATSSLSITSRNKNYNVTQFYYGTMDPIDGGNGDDIAGGTQDNGTLVIQNATSNINPFVDPFGGDGTFTEIDDSGQYMIQTYTGNSHRYVNYPTISQANSITQFGGGEFVNIAVLDKNLDILYADAGNSAVNRIEIVKDFLPGEDRYNSLLLNSSLNAHPSAMQISPYTITASNLYVGLANGKLLKIENAETSSRTWTDISGPDFVGSISDIEFGQNENEIFVTFYNYGITSIWFTNDGGSSWIAIEGNLPDLPVISILQNPLLPNELIIGTMLGVWRTSDYTATNVEWTQSFNGMSDVTVVDLDLRPSDNTILATTHGRGMFTSVFTSDVASVDEVFAENKVFSVYPTISNGDFNVVAKSELGASKMYIYDINGKLVFNSQFNFNESQTQNVSVNLKSGIYIVNIMGQNNKKSSEKIIIK